MGMITLSFLVMKNIVNTDLKPKNFDILTSDLDLNLKNQKYSFNTGFTAYEDLSKKNSD